MTIEYIEIPNLQNKVTNIPNLATPMQLGGESSTKVNDRRMIQDTTFH